MLQGLIGTKLGMTQVFTEEGTRIPVTVIQAGPVTVIQKKTVETDGYNALQVGFKPYNEAKVRKQTKARKGHFAEQTPTQFLREFRCETVEDIEVGQTFDTSIFEVGSKVDVMGTSKGRGFSGVVKRYNFAGGPASHGHRLGRKSGSIGQADPARVFKNKKMAGQYGNVRVTTMSLEVIDIKPELNAILVKGAIPGATGGMVTISKAAKG